MLMNLLKVSLFTAALSACQHFNLTAPFISDSTEAASQTTPALVDPASLELTELNYFTEYHGFEACTHSSAPPSQQTPYWVEPDTIWPRITRGFKLQDTSNARLDAEFNWYRRNPRYMNRVSIRANRYAYYVIEQVELRGMPTELALLPIVESAFDPFAYSHGRASGMWQFIPGTAKMYKLKDNWWYDGRRDVMASTQAALDYLERLNKSYKGDWLLALAAYNSGRGTVNKAIRKNRKKGKPTDFWSLDLPRETRSYVPKLLALAKLINHPQRYDLDLHPIANKPYFTAVNTQSQIDLAQAATMADVPIEEIYKLNPGFNRWATDPSGPHQLLIPAEKAEQFSLKVNALAANERLHWQRYKVKSGDSLLLLAKRFNTGVNTIKQINNINGNLIRAGQQLMIPVASANGKHYAFSATQRHSKIQKNRKGAKGTRQIFHKVKSGESLWTIARKHKVSSKKLAHWNGFAPKDYLRPGQKLSVWVKNGTSEKAKNIHIPNTKQRDAVMKKLGYTVRNGDSLARIADKFNIRIGDIVSWNSVNPKKYLQPGQRLTLYVDVMN